MRGVYLRFIPSSEGQRKLVPKLEDHVILPALSEYDVLIQVKACGLSQINTKIIIELNPSTEQIPVGYEISGIVTKAGSMVKSFTVGDEVAGILSLESECPGCAEYCTIPEYCLVKKPSSISHVDCAASLRAGIRAYTALVHQTRLESGAIVLVCSAASGEGIILLQLCEALGVKVIATVSSSEEAAMLSKLHPSLMRIVDLSSGQNLVDLCLQETGGLGVNCIIDSGVSPTYDLSDFLIESAPLKRQLKEETLMYEYETSQPLTRFSPTKHQLIGCLAMRGQWVTSQPKLQLDPPDSHLLMMKGASLHFLFEHVWLLSGAHQGDYLQILQSTMSKLQDGVLKPLISKSIALDQVCDEIVKLGNQNIGKVVMKAEGQK